MNLENHCIVYLSKICYILKQNITRSLYFVNDLLNKCHFSEIVD